jgi:tetratricopeptide (TPR) repeat protein
MRRGWRRGRFLATATLLFSTLQTAPILSAKNDQSEVELRVMIEMPPSRRNPMRFDVTLQSAAGELLYHQTRWSGETARFKHLIPGIYQVCFNWPPTHGFCRSFDLNQRYDPHLKRVREVSISPLQVVQKDAYLVNWLRLAPPEEARREMSAAQSAYFDGDLETELAHLKRAVEIFPDYVHAWNNLGVHYREIGNYNSAIACFKKATDRDPSFFAAWINLSGAHFVNEQRSEALAAGLRALELRPDSAPANQLVAMSYFHLREYEKAKVYFERHMALDPEAAESSQLYLAYISTVQKDYKGAQAYIREFLKLHPNFNQWPRLRSLSDLLVGLLSHHLASL